MTTYNTGNPVGSVDPKDLYDNAQNLDNIVNGSEHSYSDRKGVTRRSLTGIDAAADACLEFDACNPGYMAAAIRALGATP